jgi:hypothetical protein
VRALAAFVLLAAAAGCTPTADMGARGEVRQSSYYGPAPRPDATRKVSEHDCTLPLPSDGGNLRCI